MTPDQVSALLDAPKQDNAMGTRLCHPLRFFLPDVVDFHEEDGYDIQDFWIKGGKWNRLVVCL